MNQPGPGRWNNVSSYTSICLKWRYQQCKN